MFKCSYICSATLLLVSSVSAFAESQKITYGYCGEPQLGVGVSWKEYTMLVEFPESFTKEYAGAKIVGVEIASPATWTPAEGEGGKTDWVQESNNFTDITLCFYNKKTLLEEPFYKQDITLSSKAFTYTEHALNTPLVIEAGKPIFVGYSGKAVNEDGTCFAVDLNYNRGDLGCWLGWFQQDSESGEDREIWSSFTPDYGNMCLKLIVEGDNLPKNKITLNSIVTPGSTVNGEGFPLMAVVTNNAANDINSLTLKYQENGNTEYVTANFESPLKYDTYDAITFEGLISGSTNIVGNKFTYEIVGINGEENITVVDETSKDFYIRSLPKGVGYKRNVVIEEGTGTWCGYCPIGIVAIENLKEKYGNDEQLIPIAIHANDMMEIASYQQMAKDYFGGSYPRAVVNRDTIAIGNFYPEPSLTDYAYNYAKQITAIAKVAVNAVMSADCKSVNVSTITNFALDTENTYSVALAIAKNNVGPFYQRNYFYDYSEGIEMGGWEKLEEWVERMYDDVATFYENIGDISGNKAGVDYALDYTIDMKDIVNNGKLTLVAMVINNETGGIENASTVKLDSDSFVESVDYDTDTINVIGMQGLVKIENAQGVSTIYNAAGTIVAKTENQGTLTFNLPAGMYVVKSGNKTSKVLVR